MRGWVGRCSCGGVVSAVNERRMERSLVPSRRSFIDVMHARRLAFAERSIRRSFTVSHMED